MPKNISEAEKEPKTRTPDDLQHANLTNDFLFGEVFGDPLIACKTAECVLRRSLGPTESVRTQVPHNSLYGYRGIRDDVELVFETHDIIDLEMQVDNKHDDTERTQLYASHLDCFSLKSGDKDFRNAKKVTIIYFTNYDPFGHGDMVYETIYMLKGHPGELSDRLKVYFVNLKYKNKKQAEESPDLAALINYIKNSNGIDRSCELTHLVSERTMAIKEDHKKGTGYMMWNLKHMMDMAAEQSSVHEMYKELRNVLKPLGKVDLLVNAMGDEKAINALYETYCGPLPITAIDEKINKYSQKFREQFSELYGALAHDDDKTEELYNAVNSTDCEAAVQQLYDKYITNTKK